MKRPSYTPRLSREGFVPAGPAKKVARTHMLVPKPTDRSHYLPALGEWELIYALTAAAPAEMRALAQIVATADVLDVEGKPWLLVPADPVLIEQLACFQAGNEDLENDLCDEPPETDQDNDDAVDVADVSTLDSLWGSRVLMEDLEPQDGSAPRGARKSAEALTDAKRTKIKERRSRNSNEHTGADELRAIQRRFPARV